MGGRLIVVVLLAACSSEPERKPPPPFRHNDFYAALQNHAESFTLVEGDWKEDYGDAPFYGAAFYAQEGTTSANQAHLQRADQVHTRNREVIRDALLMGDTNEILMAMLGMIEHIAATGDHTHMTALTEKMGALNNAIDIFNDYIEPDMISGYAIDTYGPTSINGLVALVNLQHAALLADENRSTYIEAAERMADRLEQRAWNGETYAFSDERNGLFLYPNITMILLNARLHEATGKQPYLDRAVATYEGIQPLRVDEDTTWVGPGRYRSPYSAEAMGATTDDYTTLSSQNYLLFALALLHQVTDDPEYVVEMDHVLDFLSDCLVGSWRLSHVHLAVCDPLCSGEQVCVETTCTPDAQSEGVLHHWIDGRIALPEDPEFFCSGCNLQLLYVMWYRQQLH
ncbi:hypothetical protein ACFL6C_00910 [Myxococcota bacterium]